LHAFAPGVSRSAEARSPAAALALSARNVAACSCCAFRADAAFARLDAAFAPAGAAFARAGAAFAGAAQALADGEGNVVGRRERTSVNSPR
jgi:hypothetical protein